MSQLTELLHLPPSILSEWPAEPVMSRRDPRDFAHLITMENVDDLIDAECLALRNVVLLQDSRVLDSAVYADAGEDMPRRGAVRRHLQQGGTISLRQLERLLPAVGRLQQALHEETGHLTHVNGYLTPPGGHGLKFHYDPYVTLIVQISGRKAWPMHPPFVENPVREYQSVHTVGFTDKQKHLLAHTRPERTPVLEPGDVMWLPRGWVHSPHTVGDEASLHLTVAIKERTRHWAVGVIANELLARALIDPAMRSTITPAELLEGPDSIAKRARNYLLGALATTEDKVIADILRAAALREA